MKTITKITLALLLMSMTLFANTPNLNKLQELVKKVAQSEKMVLALDDKFPSRNTLTLESKEKLLLTTNSAILEWKTNYKKMQTELQELSKSDDEKFQSKLNRYVERQEVLQDSYATYKSFIKQSKEDALKNITHYWEENLKTKTWYIDMENGSNSNDGLSDTTALERFEYLFSLNSIIAGDTILIMGEYKNVDFGDNNVWKDTPSIRLSNLHGTANNYITIKPYDVNTVLKGDTVSIFRILNCSYIQVEGFSIEGEVQNISIATAKEYQFIYKNKKGKIKYRVKEGVSNAKIAKKKFKILGSVTRPSYTSTKGLSVTDSHHINLVGNNISYMPGAGLMVGGSDYINIVDNEVHHTSMRSYAGTHALVVHSSVSIDKKTGYKIKILRNRVHHNYNEIFSWSPFKPFITPHIDEGKGISLQKNSVKNGWVDGRILVANNIAYNNGFSGIHNNQGDRIDIFNNTCYMNSHSAVTGRNIGISSSDGTDIKIMNNIVQTDPKSLGYAISVVNNPKIKVFNNLIKGRLDSELDVDKTKTIIGEPRFVDEEGFDFRLESDSDAQDQAKVLKSVPLDMDENIRDANSPDLGAFED